MIYTNFSLENITDLLVLENNVMFSIAKQADSVRKWANKHCFVFEHKIPSPSGHQNQLKNS